MAIISKRVTGFLPSTSGFHFKNSFPQVPILTIDVLGHQIGIGDASNGLCGGMVFAVRDYFEAGIPIPPNTNATRPSSGPLFDYIVRRLFDSFNLLLPPAPPPFPGNFVTPTPPFGPGPSTYMWLMDPALPDHETVASNVGLAPRGRAWIMINDQWPKIKADIDGGRLSPIALIELKSLDPFQMGNNHQVLAYGYDLDGADLVILLYDPNNENDDTVTMSLSIADPQHTTSVTNSAVATVWCFFRPDYSFSSPPVLPAWHRNDLTAPTGAPTAAGDPAGYVFDAQGTQHVVYRDANGHINELWWDANGWHVGDLTAATGAPTAAGDPAGYVCDAQGTQHVVYRDANGHINELWWG
jgi:hypothetical protein